MIKQPRYARIIELNQPDKKCIVSVLRYLLNLDHDVEAAESKGHSQKNPTKA